MSDDLAELGERLRELVQRSPVATAVVIGREQRIVLFNYGFGELFGQAMATVSTLAEWLSLAQPDKVERGRLADEWRARLESGEGPAVPLQAELACADGLRRVMKIFVSVAGEWNLVSLVDVSEEVRTAAALRAHERKLRAIFDHAPEFIGLTNPDGVLIEANETALSFAGVRQDEVIGKPFWETPWWAHSAELQAQLRAAVTLAATGEVACLETTHRAGDGSLHEVEFRLFPVTDESDRVVALIPHGRDITDYRRAEQNLATIIESLPDATFVIDRDKRVVAWNRVLEEMTGVPKEEMLGRGDNAYSVPFYGERRPIVADLVWEGAAASDLYDNVERRGDTMLAQVYVPSLYGGRGAHVWVAASLLRDSEGNPSGVIESVRDVTERKQAEGALNTSEAKYRRLFETAKDGILILDADTSEITDVNPFLMEMLGYSRAELLGKKLWDIGLFKDIAASKSAFQTLREERHVRYENLPLDAEEGRSVEVEFVSSAYAVNGRQVIQCSIRDITERNQAEQALRAQEERIRQAYVDVLDAVTGGKLILLTDEALAVELGQPLGGCAPHHLAGRAGQGGARCSARSRLGSPAGRRAPTCFTPSVRRGTTPSSMPAAAPIRSSPRDPASGGSHRRRPRDRLSGCCPRPPWCPASRRPRASAWASRSCCSSASACCCARAQVSRRSSSRCR